jgi:hypothetical protein
MFQPWREIAQAPLFMQSKSASQRRPTPIVFVTMKRFLRLVLLLVLLCVPGLLRAELFKAADWANVKTYDVSELQKLEKMKIGQVVGIKFNYRHKKIRHLKPTWYQGSLWQHDSAAKKKFTFVQVMVAKDALPAFKSITDDFAAGGEFVAYGQILQDKEATKWRFIRLLGNKAEKDAAGNTIVSW